MSFTSLSNLVKRSPAFTVTLLIFVAIEVLVRILPMEYASGAGVFLTNHRRKLMENPEARFDYIIFGDSRSLSLMGHPPTDVEPYSIYNFSLPAMDPRYFRFYLRKYLQNRDSKPAALIFAGDPALFQEPWRRPHHDPDMNYTDFLGQGLGGYLWNRVSRPVAGLLSGDELPRKERIPHIERLVWNAFSHRFLHMFGVSELMAQFQGPERIFILREALPLQYRTYKFRDAIARHTFGLKASHFRKVELPEKCNTCEGVLLDECHPEIPTIQDNLMIAEGLAERYGQINLADRLKPLDRLRYLSIRDLHIKGQKELYGHLQSDLTPLNDLIREATEAGIPLVLTDVPSIDAYRDTNYHREYFEKLATIADEHPSVELIRFPEPYYPRELFVEQVHYECKGSERLNRDFYQSVVPNILEFAGRTGGQ